MQIQEIDEDNIHKTSHPKRSRSAVDINIPVDITVSILIKLPVKSIVRFRSVSKQWSSIIGSYKDFIDSLVARSLNKPHHDDDHFLFTQWKLNKHHPLFVSSNKQGHAHATLVSTGIHFGVFQYVRGLVGFRSSPFSPFTIHNPTTRQSASLPKPAIDIVFYFFVYDPFTNRYKVMCLPPCKPKHCYVLSLEDPTKQWKSIQCNIDIFHIPGRRKECIDGVIYFKAATRDNSYVLVSFDVSSQKFSHVEAPKPLLNDGDCFLMTYQGKLGLIRCKNGIEIWVMEELIGDEKKQEWSKVVSYEMKAIRKWRFVGVNRDGEIVFAIKLVDKSPYPIRVLYYDPELSSTRCAEIKITHPEEIKHDFAYVSLAISNHVENTMHLY